MGLGEPVFEWFQENGGMCCKTKTGAPLYYLKGRPIGSTVEKARKEALSASCRRHGEVERYRKVISRKFDRLEEYVGVIDWTAIEPL